MEVYIHPYLIEHIFKVNISKENERFSEQMEIKAIQEKLKHIEIKEQKKNSYNMQNQ